MDNEKMIAKGNCERIGVDGKIGGSPADGRKFEYEVPFENHTKAFLEVKKVLTEGDAKVIDDLSEIAAVLEDPVLDFIGSFMMTGDTDYIHKAIIQSGIAEVVYYGDKYHDSDSSIAARFMFEHAGVRLTPYKPTGRRVELEL